MPCPPDFVAVALLVALGAVIGARCSIKPKRRDDWIVTPNLFGGGVGQPSTLKTPAFQSVFKFLNRLEAREARKNEERTSVFKIEKAAYEAAQAVVQAEMKKAARDGGKSPAMNAAMQQMWDDIRRTVVVSMDLAHQTLQKRLGKEVTPETMAP